MSKRSGLLRAICGCVMLWFVGCVQGKVDLELFVQSCFFLFFRVLLLTGGGKTGFLLQSVTSPVSCATRVGTLERCTFQACRIKDLGWPSTAFSDVHLFCIRNPVSHKLQSIFLSPQGSFYLVWWHAILTPRAVFASHVFLGPSY